MEREKPNFDILGRIDRERLARGWSEYTLAENSGLTQSTLSTWRRRNLQPNVTSIEKKIEANDFEILRKIVAKAKHRVIAEGNINTPEKAKHVIELGAYSVVVGSIITRPQLITKSFVEEMER